MVSRRDSRNGRIKYAQFFLSDVRALQARTSTLSLGAWLQLFLEQLDRQEPLPGDDKTLMKITGLPARSWRKVRAELEFVVNDTGTSWSCPIAEDRIAYFKEKSAKNRRNVKSRWAGKVTPINASVELEEGE